MRIADYAVAIQSSPALQQPANATHQQQVVAPQAASDAAAREEVQRRNQVNDADETEGRSVQERESGGRGPGAEPRSKPRADGRAAEEIDESPRLPAEPGRGSILDVVA